MLNNENIKLNDNAISLSNFAQRREGRNQSLSDIGCEV